MFTPLICEKTISDDADHHGQADAGPEQLAEAAGLLAQFLADLVQFPLGLGRAVDLGQHLQGLGVPARRRPASGGSRARRTGRPSGSSDGHGLRGEHPRQCPPKESRYVTKTDSDRPMTIANWLTTTSRPRSRAGDDLGDVHRRDGRGQAHAHAADEPPEDEIEHARSQRAADVETMNRSAERISVPACRPSRVGQPDARQRSERAAENRAAGHRAHPERRQVRTPSSER